MARAWRRDATRLVSGSGDFTVRVWDSLSAADRAQPPDAYLPPRGYVCYRARGAVTIDGKLDDAAWQAVPWTEDFVDIEGDLRLRPRFRTRVKMLWDDRSFYIAAGLREPRAGRTQTAHGARQLHTNE